ncbi:hypothetical protein [Pseudaminobacter soli (ex Li et al. 2025)]|uniref:Uncharacterized protein n=1 Tax=Pseudaminobacter soli (ex Li et al. 2025) TaxID=1295366 RepID=A0A2P7S4M5_9HYPH|nr:hypothetical protein [Mesorhizobium soli]PSJ57391.1 hypothetical protein C7I85_22670 [Mesorhizobium soli]
MTDANELFDPATIPAHGHQHAADVRANQAGFQEAFGDFKKHHIVSFQIGPAPKGEWIGVQFWKEDRDVVKISIPFTLWQAFGNEYVLAMMSAGELIQVAYREAGGNA